MNYSRMDFTKAVFRLLLPYWTSEKKWEALLLLLSTMGFLAAYVFIQLELNYWNNDSFTALQNLEMEKFFSLFWTFAYLAVLGIAAYMISSYSHSYLALRWRQWLTDFFTEKWMRHRNYYHLSLSDATTDNPDQRMADDVSHFCSETLDLVMGFFQNMLTIVTFLSVLWILSGVLRIPLGETTLEIPGYMFWGALIYAVVGTFISMKVGRPLISLNYVQEKREADFRYSLIRLRDNAEGVALYGGENAEKATFKNRFLLIYENTKNIINRSMMMVGWLNCYNQVAAVFPILLIAPRYFAKEVTFGALMQTVGAFRHVNDALSFFVNKYPSIAHWKATTNRLLVFMHELDALESAPKDIHFREHTDVKVENLKIALPGKQPLLHDLSLHFKKGEHTLIMGPSGIGKSTFMRILAGFWPYGSGQIHIPSQGVMFLPQKPYMPLGSLREILVYPTKTYLLKESDFQNLLELVDLGHLFSRLDEVDDWARVLSLGEQQRISFIRALIHQPTWLLMDEATSSLDQDSEAKIFVLLAQSLKKTTFISVGHRSSLMAWHSRVIQFDQHKRMERLGKELAKA